MYGDVNPFKLNSYEATLRYSVAFAVIVMGTRFYLTNQCIFKLRATQASLSNAIADRLKALRWKEFNYNTINEIEDRARANVRQLMSFTAVDISDAFAHHEFTLALIDQAAGKLDKNWRNTSVAFDDIWIKDLIRKMNRTPMATPPRFMATNPTFQSRINGGRGRGGGRGRARGRGRGRGGRRGRGRGRNRGAYSAPGVTETSQQPNADSNDYKLEDRPAPDMKKKNRNYLIFILYHVIFRIFLFRGLSTVFA